MGQTLSRLHDHESDYSGDSDLRRPYLRQYAALAIGRRGPTHQQTFGYKRVGQYGNFSQPRFVIRYRFLYCHRGLAQIPRAPANCRAISYLDCSSGICRTDVFQVLRGCEESKIACFVLLDYFFLLAVLLAVHLLF